MSSRRSHKLAATALLAPLLGFALTACDKEEGEAKEAAKASCDGKLTPGSGAALPADLPTDSALVLTSQAAAGETKIYFGALKGTDLTGTRDALVAKLTAAGYEIEGTDQEKGVEAEAEFKGTHVGTVRVRNLCAGYTEIRYRLEK